MEENRNGNNTLKSKHGLLQSLKRISQNIHIFKKDLDKTNLTTDKNQQNATEEIQNLSNIDSNDFKDQNKVLKDNYENTHINGPFLNKVMKTTDSSISPNNNDRNNIDIPNNTDNILKEEILPSTIKSQNINVGETLDLSDISITIVKQFRSNWYIAETKNGENVLFYNGLRLEIWGSAPRNKILPEILNASDNGIVISFNDQKPMDFPSKEHALEILLSFAKFIYSFEKQGIAILDIDPTCIYITNFDVNLITLPKISKIGESLICYREGFTAPEILQGKRTTGKEGVYILGAFACKLLTGENPPVEGISLSYFSDELNIPGIPQFLTRTLVPENKRFNPKEALQYIKSIINDRKKSTLLDIGIASTVGLNSSRPVDEDSCGYIMERTHDFEGERLILKACLADGMGGMAAGEVASRAAIEGFLYGKIDNNTEQADYTIDLAWQANQSVLDELKGTNGGCTFVGAVFVDSTFSLAYAGDSRAYLWHEHRLTKLTRDHSYVASLVANGMITEEEAAISPEKNKILRSLGSLKQKQDKYIEDLSVVTKERYLELQVSAMLIMVCDGIWGEVKEIDIKNTLENNNDPQVIADKLIDIVIKNGAPDNATALVILRKR